MGHDHHTAAGLGNKLKYSIIISLAILVAEVIGGLISNSLALLSDAGHVLADVIALSLSWFAVKQAERPPNIRMTFGYHRVGVVVAIVNAISIFIIIGVILYEAYQRFLSPPEVQSEIMIIVAVIGLGANLLASYWLRKDHKTNINIRSAFWHSLGDALASIGVIIGGILILITGQMWLDILVSVVISLIIIWAAIQILRDGLHILVEAVPKDIDIKQMIESIKGIPGVKDVHDVHVWSISANWRAMNGHVLIDDIATSEATNIRVQIENLLEERYKIEHTTIQMENSFCKNGNLLCHQNEHNHKNHDK